jgi:hypothetical protein
MTVLILDRVSLFGGCASPEIQIVFGLIDRLVSRLFRLSTMMTIQIIILRLVSY